MSDLNQPVTASRSALLDLRDELGLVNDGYEFLDEKRILLAAELLRQRDEWRQRQAVFMARWRTATDALVEAAADQGLEGIEVAPPTALPDAHVVARTRPYVGQVLVDADFVPGEPEQARAALRPTPQLAACRAAFTEVIAAAAAVAASAASLARLVNEYRRTERRVRALENIVLPEIRLNIAAMEEHLELVDQEEVIRVRTLRPGHG